MIGEEYLRMKKEQEKLAEESKSKKPRKYIPRKRYIKNRLG